MTSTAHGVAAVPAAAAASYAINLDEGGSASGTLGTGDHRLHRVTMRTAAPLERMQSFYEQVLEFRTRGPSDGRLDVFGGETELTFIATDVDQPFYHFAFNIPENQIVAARNWLAERTPLMATPRHMIDSDYPDDVRIFRSWNAHAVFFWDPAGNIVELIARHDLSNASTGGFGGRSIHYASEIGLVTGDVDELARAVQARFQLPQYRNGSDSFRALGDERGLILVFLRDRPAGAENARNQTWQTFPAEVDIRNELTWRAADEPYRITVSSG